MKTGRVYSLKQERLLAERQQSVIRLLLALTSSLLLIQYYIYQPAAAVSKPWGVKPGEVVWLVALLMAYSSAVWALVRWKPEWLKAITAASSVLEVLLITYLLRTAAKTDIPFQLWYVFYVVSVATRYGWQYSVLALGASIVGFTLIACMVPRYVPDVHPPIPITAPAPHHEPHSPIPDLPGPPPAGAPTSGTNLPTSGVPEDLSDETPPRGVNVPAVLGFTGFLLILAFMFGRISEKQLSYQASLAVVNEFRAELAALINSREIIDHMLARIKSLLHVEETFFLPAKRGADGSEAIGLRSAGADPVLLSTFREAGGTWNVERILAEQRPLVSNNLTDDPSFAEGTPAKLGLRNLAAAPMMVRGVPVGAVYAANRRDKSLSSADLQLLELVATQSAPVVENALLWERLTEAAASEERLRIARDLHDSVLQNLSAIRLHLERCKILVSKDTNRALDGIDRIHQIATRSLAEVRSYLSELRLMGPEPSRFRQAIERCGADAATRGGFEVTTEINLPDEAMPPTVALAAFQIIRELLNNAATHSHAAHIDVKVDVTDGNMVIEVHDDGVGFDVTRTRAEKASEGHLGLVGVEERSRQLKGTFTLTSGPEKGTQATAVLPL